MHVVKYFADTENKNQNTNTQIQEDSTVVERADVTATQLTKFTESGVVKADGQADAMNVPMHYTDTSTIEEVRAYLQRPQQLASGAWTTASNKSLYSTNLVGSPLWNTHAHYPKVLGAFGIRAKTCFRLEVNATPQQAGHLKMYFYPFATSVANANRAVVSQLPGVDCMLGQSTAVEFSVPFVHPLDFFHVNATDGTLGSVGLYDMAGLVAASTAGAVSWTIYWWLEDVQLVGAMPSQIGSSYLNARASILSKISVS